MSAPIDTGAAGPPPSGIRTVAVEAGTSLVLAGLGLAAILDSLRLGAGWSTDGPQSGYFPFWIGVLLMAASLGIFVGAMRSKGGNAGGEGSGLFVTWPQLRLVLSVLLPTVLYVAAIPFTGLYVASAVLVTWFMIRLGQFRWWVAALSGLATALVAFVVFETWFLVSLPKGPLETWLGY